MLTLPSRLTGAGWVEAPAPTRGLDLLGLRLPVQSIGNSLLDGITTVTPTIRYLSLRSWILRSYIHSGGEDTWKSLAAFAKRVEAAIAYGNQLGGDAPAGVIGAVEARRAVAGNADPLPLKGLIQTAAIGIFTGPSDQLGLSSSRDGVPALDETRGDALGRLIESAVARNPLGAACSAGTPPEYADRAQLADFGRCVDLAKIPDEERDLLASILVPNEPTARERPRIATYGLLLDMTEALSHPPDTDDLLREAIAGRRAAPSGLASVLDGWLAYASRDLLAVVHEHAMAVLVEALRAEDSKGRSLVPRGDAIALAVAKARDTSTVLHTLDLLNPGEDLLDVRASTVRERLRARLRQDVWHRGGVSRWSGAQELDEVRLIRLARQQHEDALVLLPLVWWQMAHRFDGLTEEYTELNGNLNLHGARRFSLADIVKPIGAQLAETLTYGEAIADLLGRTADQHMRICWTRMAFDRKRDPTVFGSEGGSWSTRKNRDFRPGRTQSRIEQAVGWLRQLGLLSEHGLTAEGRSLRDKAMRLVEATEVSHGSA